MLQRFSFFLILMLCPAPAFACCGIEIPDYLEAHAEVFLGEVGGADEKRLRRLMFTGELCAENGFWCGELTED